MTTNKFTLRIQSFICILAGLLFILPSYLSAQNFEKVLDAPFLGVQFGVSAFADIDNDGDQDLIISGNQRNSSLPQSENYITKLYTNDGLGNFTEVMDTPFIGLQEGEIAFADIDGDGDQDVIISGIDFLFDQYTLLYTNDGLGNFSEVFPSPFIQVYSSDIAFADVDGDEDLDLFIAGSTVPFQAISNSSLYINDGIGGFAVKPNTPFANVQEASLDVSDIDNDGDLDLILLGTSEEPGPLTEVYINDGAGNYTVADAYDFQTLSSGDVNFADFDNDGYEDVLIAGTTDGGLTPFTKLYKNDGQGGFSEVSNTSIVELKFVSSIFTDLNNDGFVDLVMNGKDSNDPDLFLTEGKITLLYMNDGNGSFELIENTPFTNVDFGHLSFADVNGDSKNDIFLIGNSDQGLTFHSELYINNTLVNNKEEEIFENDINIYPNPASNELFIETSFNGEFTYEVFNLQGKSILGKTSNMRTINVSNMANGLYVLKLNYQDMQITKKFSVIK